MTRRLGAVIWILAALSAAAAESGPQPAPTHQEVRPVMGTLSEVRVWAAEDQVARAAVDSAFAVFTALDSLLSTWNGNSPLSRLNRAPVGQWVVLGPEACALLQRSFALAELTGGAFDPAVLPLVRLWGFRGGQAQVPTPAELAAVLDVVDCRAFEVASPRVRRLREGAALDLGGIAKGFALDQALAAALAAGAEGVLLDLGGNLLAGGTASGMEIAVVDPADPAALALSLPLVGAAATSGQYERHVEIAGQVFGHILDPRTGWPCEPGLSVTVLTASAEWGDALATAAVVLGAQQGLALLERLPGVEGLILTADGVTATSGLFSDSISH